MIDKQSHQKHIIDCLSNEYRIVVTSLTVIPLGADMDALVYKAQTKSGQSYFVKLKRGSNHDVSATIQHLLHDAGIQQIIAPLETNDGQTTHNIDGFTLTVYPFIEGKDGFSKDLTNEQWITLGKALRNIHTLPMPLLIKGQIKKESYSPQWRNALKSIYMHIDTQDTMNDPIAVTLVTFMKKHRKTIELLVNRAELLAYKIKQESPEFVLCHADIHGGNVLLANSGKLYIIDWDQPIMAPKERDLMFIGGGVGNVWNNQHEEELFYKGYGKTEINKDTLAYYRCERIVEDIAEYYQQLTADNVDTKDKLQSYNYLVAMFKQNGVVDKALKT